MVDLVAAQRERREYVEALTLMRVAELKTLFNDLAGVSPFSPLFLKRQLIAAIALYIHGKEAWDDCVI